MSLAWIALPAVLVALVVFGLVPYLVATAHRLDRLHVRTDAAWAGLDAALARRAVVARTVAAVREGEHAERLRAAADHAEHAPRIDREAAENQLTGRLTRLPRHELGRALAEELADAEHRVVLARRVHNDAVRDTKALRSRRVVRWLRLAGTAPEPSYFEIAEPEVAVASAPSSVRRRAGVLLVDGQRRLLLFAGRDPARPSERWWSTPGGGVATGEHLRETAVRQLREEAGVALHPEDLVGPMWRRRATFPSDGATIASDEWYFLARMPGDGSGGTPGDACRWWTARELADCTETIYPEQVPELLPGLLSSGWDGQLRTVH